MANCKRELIYRHWNDCKMEGCPPHKAMLEFQSVTCSYYFNLDGKEIYLDSGELQAMVDLVKSLNRADTVNFQQEGGKDE